MTDTHYHVAITFRAGGTIHVRTERKPAIHRSSATGDIVCTDFRPIADRPGAEIVCSIDWEGVVMVTWWPAVERNLGGRPPETSERDLLRVLAAQPGRSVASQSELADLAGVTRKVVARLMPGMVASGLVCEVPGPRGSTGYRLLRSENE